jgi:hypothetical protein
MCSLVRLKCMKRAIVAVLLLLLPLTAEAETPEEWITLGARVHGAFGAFIPLGIKIGLDAVKRLNTRRSSWPMSSARFASVAINCVVASLAVLRFEPAATMPPSTAAPAIPKTDGSDPIRPSTIATRTKPPVKMATHPARMNLRQLSILSVSSSACASSRTISSR